jgi:hypothetical protein
VAGFWEHSAEPSDYIKCWEFLGELSNSWVLRKDAAPGSELVVYSKSCCY